MATEEIEISELELADELAPDNLIPIESLTETKATTLQKIKNWFGSSTINSSVENGVPSLRNLGKFGGTPVRLIQAEDEHGTTSVDTYYSGSSVILRLNNYNKTTKSSFSLDITNKDDGTNNIGINGNALLISTSSNSANTLSTTKFVKDLHKQVSTLPANPDYNVFYYIPEV